MAYSPSELFDSFFRIVFPLMCLGSIFFGFIGCIHDLNFFELVTSEPVCGWWQYYFFYQWKDCSPRSIELTYYYPDKLRELVKDRNEEPLTLRHISFSDYIYKKYIKRPWQFSFGYRVNWKKEKSDF